MWRIVSVLLSVICIYASNLAGQVSVSNNLPRTDNFGVSRIVPDSGLLFVWQADSLSSSETKKPGTLENLVKPHHQRTVYDWSIAYSPEFFLKWDASIRFRDRRRALRVGYATLGINFGYNYFRYSNIAGIYSDQG